MVVPGCTYSRGALRMRFYLLFYFWVERGQALSSVVKLTKCTPGNPQLALSGLGVKAELDRNPTLLLWAPSEPCWTPNPSPSGRLSTGRPRSSHSQADRARHASRLSLKKLPERPPPATASECVPTATSSERAASVTMHLSLCESFINAG